MKYENEILFTVPVQLEQSDYNSDGIILSKGTKSVNKIGRPLIDLVDKVEKIAKGAAGESGGGSARYEDFQAITTTPIKVDIDGRAVVTVRLSCTIVCGDADDLEGMGVPLFSEISTALFSAHALFRKIVIDDVRSSRYSVNGIQMENGECIPYGSVEEMKLYDALHGVPAMSITIDAGGQVRVLEIEDFRMPVLGENTEPYVRLFTIQNSAPNCTSMKIVTTNKTGDKSIGANVVYADELSHLFTERTLDTYKGRLTPYRYKSSRVGRHGLHYWLSKAEVKHGADASAPYGKQVDLM